MTDRQYDTITLDQQGAIARLCLNRPDQLNAINPQMRQELLHAINAVNSNPTVRAVILAGEGRAFSAGADLSADVSAGPNAGMGAGPLTEHTLKVEYKPSIMGIVESPKLWMAAVGGAAAGVGSAFMLACDLVVMAESAYMYQAFAAISLIPDGGATWQLLRTLGRKRATELILGGERIQAARCLEYGLCNRVVADGEELAAAEQWAQALAAKAPLAVEYTKKALNMAADLNFGEMISQEAVLQSICISSDDFREGTTAFFEKRQPEFKGR